MSVDRTMQPYNVLFLCTGNSARSIIAEALLNHLGGGRFRGYSAGSQPTGYVNPLVLEHLESKGIRADGARSKSWDEFAAPGAPQMDLVVTVCDAAAGETCPVWPGRPARAHWSAPDPPSWIDDPIAAQRVIREVFLLMQQRIAMLANLPVETLDRLSLQSQARAIAERV
jgi:protein-tyrosine-phosphatase